MRNPLLPRKIGADHESAYHSRLSGRNRHPAASMTLTSNDGSKVVAVWIDNEAMNGADRLIHAGVNRWDPRRLLPFVACIVDSGTEITVTGLHAFNGYADVVVTSSSCAGVVHLDAIKTN